MPLVPNSASPASPGNLVNRTMAEGHGNDLGEEKNDAWGVSQVNVSGMAITGTATDTEKQFAATVMQHVTDLELNNTLETPGVAAINQQLAALIFSKQEKKEVCGHGIMSKVAATKVEGGYSLQAKKGISERKLSQLADMVIRSKSEKSVHDGYNRILADYKFTRDDLDSLLTAHQSDTLNFLSVKQKDDGFTMQAKSGVPKKIIDALFMLMTKPTRTETHAATSSNGSSAQQNDYSTAVIKQFKEKLITFTDILKSQQANAAMPAIDRFSNIHSPPGTRAGGDRLHANFVDVMGNGKNKVIASQYPKPNQVAAQFEMYRDNSVGIVTVLSGTADIHDRKLPDYFSKNQQLGSVQVTSNFIDRICLKEGKNVELQQLGIGRDTDIRLPVFDEDRRPILFDQDKNPVKNHWYTDASGNVKQISEGITIVNIYNINAKNDTLNHSMQVMHITNWPDHGTISVENNFKLAEMAEKLKKFGETSAVHCTAGVGRTGTLLTADAINKRHNNPSSLQMILQQFRTERGPSTVQSEEQLNMVIEMAKKANIPLLLTNDENRVKLAPEH